jgi:DNA-directed RNA polymerase specialized sigma24 family protein
MATNSIRWIATKRIEFDPSIAPEEIDVFEQFACSCPSTSVNALFEALHATIVIWAGRVRTRTKSSVLRVTDDKDWTQEVLLALWRKYDSGAIFRSGRHVRRYVNGILAKQAARAAKRATRSIPYAGVRQTGGPSVADELIAVAENHRLRTIAERLDRMMADARRALDETLAALPNNKAMAVRAHLHGETLLEASHAAGLTVGVLRGLLARLKRGSLAIALRCIRSELEKLYRLCPRTASEVELGCLARLISDPDDAV